MPDAALECFALRSSAGLLRLAAPRMTRSEARREAEHYFALPEARRLRYLARTVKDADSGRALASVERLRRSPLKLVRELEAALWRLRLEGEDGLPVTDEDVAAAVAGLGATATAAEIRRGIEVRDRAAGRLEKWEIVAARLLAVVRGIVGLRSKADDLFADYPPKREPVKRTRQSPREQMIEWARAMGAEIR